MSSTTFDFSGVGRTYIDQALASGPPFTVSVWYYITDLSVESQLFRLRQISAPVYRFDLHIKDSAGGNYLTCTQKGTSGFASASTTVGAASNTWQNAIATWTSNSSRECWINNANSSANTTNVGTSSSIGRTLGPGADDAMEGSCRAFAMWNVALDAGERAALAAGIDPRFVRPQSLVAYLPLLNGDATTDLINGDWTTSGTISANASGPRIIQPNRQQISSYSYYTGKLTRLGADGMPRGPYVGFTPRSGATAYDITAGAGSYSISGTAASLEFGGAVVAGAGSYSISGTAASLLAGYAAAIEAGAYSISGQAVTFDHSLTAASGAYSISGQAAGLVADIIVTAEGGSYSITGQNVGLLPGFVENTEAGSYTISGTAAALTADRSVTAGAGSYSISGQDATLTYGNATDFPMVAAAGAYAISGTAASLEAGLVLGAASGAYEITGSAAGVYAGYAVTIGAGSYSISGQDAALNKGFIEVSEGGSYSISGTPATLTFGGVIEGSGSMVSPDAGLSGTATKGGLIVGYVTQDEEYRETVPLWPVEGFGPMRASRAKMSGTGEVSWRDYNVRTLLILSA